jgi:uncharacterized protein (TIGR03437 family)
VGVPVWYRTALFAGLTSFLYAFDAGSTYNIRTVAGTSFTGDGRPAAGAILIQPEGLAFDSQGSLYIADPGDSRVRKVDSSGRISTLAGSGYGSLHGDGGQSAAARVNAPYDVCADRLGNVYIADLGNARIRKISPDGVITTVAGGGLLGPDPVLPRQATEAQLVQPRNITIDARGILYISDFGAHRIYQVTPDGKLSIFAGTGEPGTTEDAAPATLAKLSSPAGLAVDSAGNVYVADSGSRFVKRIFGQRMWTVRDSAGRAVEFATPTSIAADQMGTLYVADGSSIVTTVSSAGKLSFLPVAAKTLTLDAAGRLFVVAGKQVQRFDSPGITIIAGTGLGGFAGDGRPSSDWRFSGPSGIVRDSSGNLYIADAGNGRVRQLTPARELTTLIAGLARPVALAIDTSDRLYVADAASGLIQRYNKGSISVFSRGTEDKPYVRPSGLAFDKAGNLFVADSGNNLIRKISTDGVVTTIAGGGGLAEDSHPLRVRLAGPAGVTIDGDGNLWFTEGGSGLIRKLSASGQLSTLKLDLKEPRGIKIDANGSLYVADAGTHRVIAATHDGNWWPIAGSGNPGISDAEGPALDNPMLFPSDILLQAGGRIAVADPGSGRIQELVPAAVTVPPPDKVVPSGLTIAHAATQQNNGVAPGQVIIIRGQNLIDQKPAAGGVASITVDGAACTVLSASSSQILAVLPSTLIIGLSELRLSYGGVERGSAPVTINRLAPGIFTAKEGSGQALALNEDGIQNSVENPAARGSIVSLFGTGHGAGAIEASVEIGGYSAETLYAGSAPGQPGTFQINVRTPSGFAPSGVQPLKVLINGVPAQTGVTVVTR